MAIFHFVVHDSPSDTLNGFNWPDDCRAIICGGRVGDDASNALGDDVVDAVEDAGITLDGVSGNSGAGVNPDGSWFQHGK